MIDNCKSTYVTDIDSADYIRIPKARDGSLFLPNCKQRQGYKIGRKGEEAYFETYREALKALLAMPTPYWRRPNNKSGCFGIVRGEEWVKIATSKIVY